MAFLIKFIALPLYPLGLVLTLWLAGICARFLKWKYSHWLFIAGGFFLFIFSSQLISDIMISSLEKPCYNEQAPPGDCSAIVVLGGSGRISTSVRKYPEINEAGDRIIHGARLYRMGICSRVITSGGWVDPALKDMIPEGVHNARLLMELGVDSNSIIVEKKAKNTHEHGPYISQILDSLKLPRKIVLVTSASHMKRSVAVFKKSGFTVYTASTDFRCSHDRRNIVFKIFPNSDALNASTWALHEYYGLLAYKLLGYID